MGNVLDGLSGLIAHNQVLGSFLIGLSVIIQGETAAVLSTYLIASRKLSWVDYLVPAFSAIMISDYLLFFVGRRLRKSRFGWKLYRRLKDNRNMQLYHYYVSKKLGAFIILSKFLIGINLLAIFSAGWGKIKFSTFFKSHLKAVLIWLFSVSAVAYLAALGLYSLTVNKVFKGMEFFIIGLVVVLIGSEWLFKKVLWGRMSFEKKAAKIGEAIDAAADQAEED